MSHVNINLLSNIPYGIISASRLDDDLVHDLLYTYGDDLSYKDAMQEFIEAFYRDPINTYREYEYRNRNCSDEEIITILEDEGLILIDEDTKEILRPDEDTEQMVPDFFQFSDHYQCEERIVQGVHKGVYYLSTYIGGALNFVILDSPHITDHAHKCSPCVPNAGNLDDLSDEPCYTCYDVPKDWRRDNDNDNDNDDDNVL